MEELASLHAIVHGHVQGVLFRDFVQFHAEMLGLTGYVKNLPGGTVEVCAEGAKGELLELLQRLEVGPPRARVGGVDVTWGEYSGRYPDFQVRYF